MVTRNDDPPDDPEADRRAQLEEDLQPLLDAIVAFVLKRVDEAYADGYVTGASDNTIEIPYGHEEGSGT